MASKWLLTFLLMCWSPFTLTAASVSAQLGASQIPVGGYTLLTITVDGSTRADVRLPEVDGLILRDSGTSQNTSIINGKISKSSTVRVTVLGDKEGSYTIPALKVVVEGKDFTTEPVQVKVTNSPSASSGQSANAQSGTSSGSETLTADDIHRISRIQILSPNATIYVGQKVPITIQLWVNTAHRFDNLTAPVINDDHILMAALGQDYERTIEYADNERFEVYSWKASFTALKEGTTTLEADTEVTVLARARRATSAFDSMFDSDFFGPSYRRIPLLIKSNQVNLEIKPVPTEQPEGFSGAVGKFSMKTSVNPTELQLGDPITLDVEISGTGNFDRVFFEGLKDGSGFKTYTPETQFTPDENDPLKGSKSFKQAIIPKDKKLKEIPSIRFIYFNTETAQFETLESPPVPIVLNVSSASSNPQDVSSYSKPGSGLEVIESDGWIALQVELDSSKGVLRPFIQRPAAWMILSGLPLSFMAYALLLPLLILKSQSNQQQQQLKELRKKLKRFEHELNQALKNDQKTAFIESATHYTREILGVRWNVAPHSITPADAKQRLGDSFIKIRELLMLSDSLHYAGGAVASIDIVKLHDNLQTEWSELIQSIENK